MFSHGFPTPSRLVTDAPKAKLSTATFTCCIQPPWQHVRQPHGRNAVRGPVGALLWMLLYDLDTTNCTSNSLPTPRPPHFPLPAFHSTDPRPPSPFHRLSPPSSRRPFSPSLRPLFSPPSTASKATPPPVLRPLHSVPTPAEFNPDDDHYDTTRDLPKVITHTAFTRQLGIEGQDIARVPLLNFLH